MKITVSLTRPTTEGKYIFVGKYTQEPEIITVVKYPAKWEYGTQWEEYLGVAGHRGRHISRYDGYFSERIEDVVVNVFEHPSLLK